MKLLLELILSLTVTAICFLLMTEVLQLNQIISIFVSPAIGASVGLYIGETCGRYKGGN